MIDPNIVIEQSRIHVDRKNYDDAVNLLTETYKKMDSPEILHTLLDLLYSLRNYSETRKVLEELLRRYSSYNKDNIRYYAIYKVKDCVQRINHLEIKKIPDVELAKSKSWVMYNVSFMPFKGNYLFFRRTCNFEYDGGKYSNIASEKDMAKNNEKRSLIPFQDYVTIGSLEYKMEDYLSITKNYVFLEPHQTQIQEENFKYLYAPLMTLTLKKLMLLAVKLTLW